MSAKSHIFTIRKKDTKQYLDNQDYTHESHQMNRANSHWNDLK
jgi:hypothetical protein